MVTSPAPHPGECLMPGQTGTAADVSGKQPVSSPAKVSEQAGRPMPRHIAIIMDGNGRWAVQQGLPRIEGHRRGVASVRREWLNVARTLEVGPWRKAFEVILPAAAPTIFTGMRISMGIAWLVIVAAEMLVGGTGIGYFVWNEWNNLSLPNVIFAILVIGVVGMLLDLMFARFQRAVTYAD